MTALWCRSVVGPGGHQGDRPGVAAQRLAGGLRSLPICVFQSNVDRHGFPASRLVFRHVIPTRRHGIPSGLRHGNPWWEGIPRSATEP